ncbi:hypothetical protein A2W48_02585 [Candidatus Giovannonibacteria bacterium RIFCSPHIGHO2_12_44_12]|uniref:Phospholipase C/D domain-containing protein n=4 Tax=Candidatus Giovannoniibacteriota TaxID=1752738 RepID=A0A1F5WYS1_9BACT|nr:MAG: hypothetical protein A2W57_02780 [Candidatus Giovannonibacteria bacterium RIFCSPHIGHO2_02_43_16]OGF80777.1 MAG: hypothetical protein A2W48_02585 [Candidatus Giovannonibacteria bacterium RIFCSPHIGHO2_12_44_12]OGF86432.1 MAG: hypothetical protein A2Z63_01635 [Candidatus Giovannonibacteria bacterium RIFCSPLOWO2_02_44_8]OGF94983.1 MAG: hypothetical protein A2Y47_01130 [Candidatus Giovannonibacteria bacterium RIFCSPLOWO2_12_43_8]
MDIISHGLWGGITLGRENKKSFWTSFIFGIAPDFLAFAPFFASVFLGFAEFPKFSTEPPIPDGIPAYVHNVYSFTHSLIIFAVVFGLIVFANKFLSPPSLKLRRTPWEMSAWGLHILFDIPTHSNAFFPTPFLWPYSSAHIDGIPWAHPAIFIPNIAILIILYLYFFAYKKRETNHF